MFTHPLASVPGITMSAFAAPALVSGPITSVCVGGYATALTAIPPS